MQIAPALRNRLFAATLLGILLASSPVPAHAASKEIIELQTQVQQLLDMVQRLQSTLDGRMGVLQHMLEQAADNSNQMAAAVSAMQQKLGTQTDSTSGKLDAVSGQVQSLNDSVDELKSRIAQLNKSMQDMQAQLQNIQNPPPAAAPAGTPGTEAAPAGDQSAPPPGSSQAPAPSLPAAAQTPPLQNTYESGLRDYNSARYGVATGEFQDVIHYYPLDDLAGAAQFYLGEIAYRQQNYADAISAYNAVIEGFPGSPKAPASQLHKGLALLKLNKRAEGIRELRLLIQRHPQTPEAAEARNKLGSMGIHVAR
jgi:tol-pal system protein YbgF